MRFVQRDTPQNKNGYTGFLYVRCPKCGKEMGFCPKKPITHAFCYECGEKFKLPERMTVIKFWCECGHHWKYLTNITDKMFDIRCIACGSPNAVIMNHKQGRFVKV